MARKVSESSGNIFLDIGFPPHEAEVMLLRAKLAEALREMREALYDGSRRTRRAQRKAVLRVAKDAKDAKGTIN